MYKEICHLYGPFSIQSFGFFIVMGLALFSWLVIRHPARRLLLSKEQFFDILTVGLISATLGARLLYILIERDQVLSIVDIFTFWDGGFSLLGAIIGIFIGLTPYLAYCHIPIIPFFDLIAVHALLLQAIARIGCLCSGCCYGTVTTLAWGIYSEECAQLVHPTQLYSAGILFALFLLVYFIAQPYLKKIGQMTCFYLILMSIERFTVDFFRGDREYSDIFPCIFSIHQYIALCIIFGSLIMLVFISFLYYYKIIE